MNQNSFFVKLGKLLLHYPKTAIALILLEFLVLVFQLPNLQIDTSIERFLHRDAKPILDYDDFRKEFGRDEFFMIAIIGQDVFTPEFLTNLKAFHGELELGVDRLQSVESLVNVRSIYGEEDDLIVEELLDVVPETEEEIEAFKTKIRGKEVYYDRLINDDEDAVTILIKVIPYIQKEQPNGEIEYVNLGDAELSHAYYQIEDLVEANKKRFPGAEIHIGGTPASGSYMSRVIQQDFGTFTGVAIVMIIVVLGSLFKRVSGVVVPMLVMAVGVTSTIAMLPVLGFPMQITTSIIPSFLLAVCIGDAVHLLTIFYQKYDHGMEKREAILYAMDHTGLAVFFTSITTAAGLLTFAFSDILPIASLGLFAAIGSIVAFAITVTSLPVLLYVFPVKRKEHSTSDQMKEGGLLYKFTALCVHVSTQYPKSVVGVAASLMIAAMIIVPNIQFSQDSLEWFPDDTKVKIAIKEIEKEITGSMPVEIVIDTGEPNGALEPEFLKKLDGWLSGITGTELNGIPIMNTTSIVNLVKETHQAFNGNKPEAYTIPQERTQVAQELLMIEMDKAEDLYQYIDHAKQKARITLIVPWADAIKFADFIDQLKAGYIEHMGTNEGLQITGVIPIFSNMFTAMIQSAAQSYMIAALAIGFMMILLMRSLIDGLLSMIPNLLPILMVLSYMVITGLSLDIFTVLIGSVALGLSVDDTVHFMHGFKAAYAKSGNTFKAIEDTLFSTGKALLITTIVLFWGFMTFTLSGLVNMDLFGILTAMCITLAFLADFLVAPALMVLRYGKPE